MCECVCVPVNHQCVPLSPVQAIITQIGSISAKHLVEDPFCLWGWLIFNFNVKLNLNVKINRILDYLSICRETIASETHRWLWSHPTMLGSMFGCRETIGGCARKWAIQSRNTGTCSFAIGISWIDWQILLKIGVAIIYRHSDYKSVWTFRSIIDTAIDLITLKNQYHCLWIRAVPRLDFSVAGCERQLFITGRQNGIATTQNRSKKQHNRTGCVRIAL